MTEQPSVFPREWRDFTKPISPCGTLHHPLVTVSGVLAQGGQPVLDLLVLSHSKFYFDYSNDLVP